MAYYRGDYYQGDYYQGDPFLGALIGAGASWLGKKLFGRGIQKAGQAAAGKMIVSGTGKSILRQGPGIVAGAVAGQVVSPGFKIPLPGPFTMQPGAAFPGGQPFITRTPTPTAAMAPAGCCPPGYHLSKTTGACVRNRRMNVANPKALRRSLRRVAGFGKLAQRSKRDIKRAAKAIGA